VLGVSACFLFSPQETGPVFDHALHVKTQGMTCAECHPTTDSSDRAGMPTLALCLKCHEEIDSDKPEDVRAVAFFDEQGHYKRRAVATLSEEIVFSHRPHVYLHRISCEECHGKVGASRAIPPESAVKKDECMACHRKAGKTNACNECHSKINSSWIPYTHKHLWDIRHGQVVRSQNKDSANRCAMCHAQPASCDACHQATLPRDHTNHWRRRSHAFVVSLDRSRCATCHRSNFCNRCHLSTRPRGHRGGFGSPQNRHCLSCHLPLRGEGCYTCHKATPSHALAAPMPGWHTPAMNCRQCHGVTATLPHPDNGGACTACHK
jgi:hypothetical protein